jgi:Mrp family chromosome partitioning ATPase
LDPARRAELQEQRKSVVAQIAARRAGLKRSDTPAAAAPSAKADASSDVIELETQWHKLRLDLERARDAFRKAEDKERAARLQATSAEREVQESLLVTDAAFLPVHPESGRGRVFFAGALVAIFVALGYAGARVLLCDTLFDEGDVLALGSPPLLVSVPHIPETSAPQIIPTIHATDLHGSSSRNEHNANGSTHGTNGVSDSDHALALPDENIAARMESTLARAVPLPANAIDPYTECEAPNVVVIGVPFEPLHAPVDALVKASPPRVLGALRVLRHRLEQRRGDDSLVVSVQSAAEGEGKTTIAARLALTLAEAERARVVLVEGNLARPKLAATLGLRLPDDLGLTMQIRKHMGGQDAPWSVVRIGASVYALVESADESAFPAALHSMWFRSVIQALKQTYDYVVLDGCAVLDAGDGNVLEEVSDAVVLIARAGVTSGSMVASAARQLGERRIFGVVLNDAPSRQS